MIDPRLPAVLALDGTVNTRDIGGLTTSSGQTVRRGVVFRSDGLRELSARDLDLLVDRIGVRAIYDLRSPIEVSLDGIGPIESRADVGVRERPLIGRTTDNANLHTYTELDYRRMFAEGADNVAAVIAELAEPGGTPAIIHCTAGKDRTGIVVAVLLELLGVPRSSIYADYLATQRNLTAIVRRVAELPSARRNPARPESLSLSTESIEAVFQVLDHAGGASSWLTSRGVGPETTSALRDRLLT